MDNKLITQIVKLVTNTTLELLEKRGLICADKPDKPDISDKSAYAKTESLLFSYMKFKRIVENRMQEIKEIQEHGVPKNCGVAEYVQKGGLPQGIVLEEESVESAVRRILWSVQDTVQVIALIDKCMDTLRNDPYFKVLEMRYFEGRTQEDIAVEFGCTQGTIAKNKGRLVRELAMQLFPDQVARELMK